MKLLLNEGGDFSTREISRMLKIPLSTVHYHLLRLVELGILTREEIKGRILRAYYTPQPIFTENPDGTLKLLRSIAEKIDGASDDKLVKCVEMFLKCYDSL